MGHEVLKRVAEPVEDPTAPEIARLVRDMIESCEDADGNGIVVPQFRVPLCLFVYRVRAEIVPSGAAMRPIPRTVVVNPVLKPITVGSMGARPCLRSSAHCCQSGGAASVQPVSRSKARPARNRVASSNGRPMSWNPQGRPFEVKPQGIASAGRPR